MNREEEIIKLVREVAKDFKNIPDELIEKQIESYLQDLRSLDDIRKEIFNISDRIKEIESFINKDISEDVLENSIILIGPMGTGKSTISKMFSEDMNMESISLDDRNKLKDLYQYENSFNNFKDFEFFLTGNVLTSLDKPSIIDFGAGHSVYEDPILFFEIKSLIDKFDNVVLLLPSKDKNESLNILNERRNIEKYSSKYFDNKHFVYSPYNEILAKDIVYTKDKSKKEVLLEIKDFVKKGLNNGRNY